MEFNEYQIEALKTLKPGLDHEKKVFYFCGKMAEEVGEIIGPLFKNQVHGKLIPENHVISELGDLLYYLSALAAEYGVPLEEVAKFNINKLRERHGQSYNPDHYKK